MKEMDNAETYRRHEILGLQGTNEGGSRAQFYPSCHQISITGGGQQALPAGIAIPGAYTTNDKGVWSLSHWLDSLADNLSRLRWNIVRSQHPIRTRLRAVQCGVIKDGATDFYKVK